MVTNQDDKGRRGLSDGARGRFKVQKLNLKAKARRAKTEPKGFGARLAPFRLPGETWSAFGLRIDVPMSTLKSWLRGDTEPRGRTLSEIAARLDVSVDVLAGTTSANVAVLRPELVFVPRYEFRVSAGAGVYPDDEKPIDSMAFQRDWVRHKLGRDPDRLMLTEARGTSMEPIIEDGDLLLVDLGDRAMVYEQPVVVRLDGVLLVKEIRPAGGDAIRVVGSNEPPERGERIPLDQVDDRLAIIGRVRWIGRVLS
jgi:hypothetical protein